LENKWAAEPWSAAEGRVFIKGEDGWGSIVDAQDWFIAKLEDSLDPAANAARIVACVNALAGLDPAAVPLVVEALEACVETLAPLRGQAALAPRVEAALDRAKAALDALKQQ
jgi:hypothetical protein